MLSLLTILFGGIVTGWGIRAASGASSSSRKNIFKNWVFYIGIFLFVLVGLRIWMDSYFLPYDFEDPFITFLNHITLIGFLIAIALMVYAILQSLPAQQGKAAVLLGLLIIYLGSLRFFYPAYFHHFFRSILIITPDEFFASVLFFILGLSFVFGVSLWMDLYDRILKHLADDKITTSKVAVISITIGVLFLFVFLTTQPFFPSWFNRLSGIKTPFLEADLTAPTPTKSNPKLFQAIVSNWPKSLVECHYIEYNIDIYKKYEAADGRENSSLVMSLNALDSFLSDTGFYRFSQSFSDPEARPSFLDLTQKANCWTQLFQTFSVTPSCQYVFKEPSINQVSTSSENQIPGNKCFQSPKVKIDKVLKRKNLKKIKENLFYYVILASLFQYIEDFKKSERILRAGIEKTDSPAELGMLQSWLGFTLFNQPQPLIQERHDSIAKIWRHAIINNQQVIRALSKLPDTNSDSKNIEKLKEFWELLQLQTKSYLAFALAENRSGEWSARHYVTDIENAVKEKKFLLNWQPEFLDTIGWVKVNFHKDLDEVREAKALFKEVEIIVKDALYPLEVKTNILRLVRYHHSVADEILYDRARP